MIGDDVQTTAVLQHAREPGQIVRVDETSSGMTELGPGIGMDQMDMIHGCIGQRVQNMPRVVVIDAHIGDAGLGQATRPLT